MSNLNYTNWWRNGTIGATKNSTEITGASTYWSTTNINPGDIFIDNSGIYEIQSVTDDTHLTLATPYLGETGTGLAYAIIRNFTATTNAKVAAMTSELMYEFARFIDNERSTITGKSAYEIAKDNGYVGTEAQWLESLSAYGQAKKNGYTGTLAEWLESLKAAGEWTSADTRLTNLESSLANYITVSRGNDDPAWRKKMAEMYYHNVMPRWRSFESDDSGDVRDKLFAVLAQQRRGDYSNLYVGDKYYFRNLSGNEGLGLYMVVARIMQEASGNYRHLVECVGQITGNHELCTAVMNDTAATTGGYMASKMYTDLIPNTYLPIFEELLGDHLIAHDEYIHDSNTVDAGEDSHAVKTSSRKLDLLDIAQISPLKEIHNRWAEANPQLPLFALPSYNITGNYWFSSGTSWFQDVSPINPTTDFCLFNPCNGRFGHGAANGANYLIFHFVLY